MTGQKKSPLAKGKAKTGRPPAARGAATVPAVKADGQIQAQKSSLPKIKEPSLPEAKVQATPPTLKPDAPMAAISQEAPGKTKPAPPAKAPPGPGSDKIKIEDQATLTEVLARFGQIVEALRSGEAVVAVGAEFVRLRPGGRVEFEIKAVRKKEREKISLEMSWPRQPD